MDTEARFSTVRSHVILLVWLTLLVFLQVLHNGFVNYDDPVFVTQNPRVLAGPTLDSLRWAFTTDYADYWRPLSWVSHMLDVRIYGLKPGGHHLTSLLIHLASVLLLFTWLNRATGCLRKSFVVSALFAWHPLHVESVAWVAERKDVLCGLFWVLALHAQLRLSRAGSWVWHLALFFAGAAALMSKPMAVTLPFALLLVDGWPLGRYRTVSWGRLVLEKVPLFAFSAVVSVATVVGQVKMEALTSADRLGLGGRVGIALASYGQGIWRAVVPVNLAVFYPRPEVVPAGWAILGGLLAGLGLVWGWGVRRERPWVLAGICWFLGLFFPVSGILQAGDQMAADRYLYLPLVGLFWVVVWELGRWGARVGGREVWVRRGENLVLLLCGLLSWHQVSFWKDTITLFEHARQVVPRNYLAATVVGSELVSAGRLGEAIPFFEHAALVNPQFADVHLRWGLLLERQEKPSEALVHYRKAVELKSTHEEARMALGRLLLKGGDLQGALTQYEFVLRLDPDSVGAHNNLGLILHQLGDPAAAMGHYGRAVSLDPKSAVARQGLGLALHALGRHAEAVSEYERVLESDPGLAGVHVNLGVTLRAMGRIVEAVRHYEEAIRLKPDWARPLLAIAWIRSVETDPRNRDGVLALRLAEAGVRLAGPEDASALMVKAVALAEGGRFDEAQAVVVQAVALARSQGRTGLVDELGRYGLLFAKGQPVRESRPSAVTSGVKE